MTDETKQEELLKLETQLSQLKAEFEYWKNYQPVNNMGKWSKQVRLKAMEERIVQAEKDIQELNRN